MKFAAVMAIAAAEELTATEYKFMSFITEYGRSYATKAEYNFRLNQFSLRVAEHERWNSISGQTSTQGVNFLTDRTDGEITKMGGYKADESSNNISLEPVVPADMTAFAEIDWRSKGAVTPVKDQLHCGGCYAFGAIGNMEAAHHKVTGNLIELSEQNIIDCDWLNHGCNGGNPYLAFEYASTRPIMAYNDYPYTGTTSAYACKYNKSKGQVKVLTYGYVGIKDVTKFYSALQDGPITSHVDCQSGVFSQYTGGILTGPSCGTKIMHSILVIGYGLEANQQYWLVKNSWGTEWGEKGFIRLGVEEGAGVCGVQVEPSQVTTD